MDYDDNGQLSRKGVVNDMLLSELHNLSFYKEKPPKSLGLEWVQMEVIPLIEKFQLEIKDILRTLVEHIAIQIHLNTKTKKKSSLLVTGGGAFNGFLMERIKGLSSNKVVVPDSLVVNYKEALIFAFLGVLKFRNEINCLSSVTGASKDHSTGKIYL